MSRNIASLFHGIKLHALGMSGYLKAFRFRYLLACIGCVLVRTIVPSGRFFSCFLSLQDTDSSTVRVKQDIRLDNRILDMRVPAQNAIMRINSAVCHYFRGALLEKGFVEIHTPKVCLPCLHMTAWVTLRRV